MVADLTAVFKEVWVLARDFPVRNSSTIVGTGMDPFAHYGVTEDTFIRITSTFKYWLFEVGIRLMLWEDGSQDVSDFDGKGDR